MVIEKEAIERVIRRAVREHFLDVNGQEPAIRPVQMQDANGTILNGQWFSDAGSGDMFIVYVKESDARWAG